MNDNITIYYGTTYNADGTYTTTNKVEDANFALSASDGKSTITVTAKNGDFEKYGYYYVTFKDKVFVAKTGESILRKDATIAKKETTGKTPFVTPFTLGSNFDYVSVTTVKELPPEVVASRAAFASNEEYLKVTFTKEIKKSVLNVNNQVVKNYIKGAEVYLPLSDKALTDNDELKLTGDVTAIDGAKKTYETASPISTYYRLSKSYFKMIKSSLYDEKAAIAGKNDVVNQLIDASDADAKVTFTFDQNIEGATWTAELYDKDTVSARNLDNSLFKATPTAAGDVLTVTLNDGTKKLEANKKYFLSIKAVSKVNTEVVLFDSDKASITTTGTTPTIYYGKLSDNSTYLCTKIIDSTTVNGNKYIYFNTKGYYVLKAAEDNVTTTFAKFNESRNSEIKIQFNQKLTADWKAVLGLATATQPDTYDALDLTKTYASIATVADDVITITPTYTLPSKTQINPWVFDAKGKKVDLKLDEVVNDSHPDFFASSGADKEKSFVTKDTSSDDELDKAIEAGVAEKNFTLTQINVAETGTGSTVYFTFNPILTKVGTDADYGTYQLYRKVTKATEKSKWVAVGKPYKILTAADSNYQYLQYADKNKKDEVKDGKNELAESKTNAVAEDFAVRKMPAIIAVSTAGDEFSISKTSEYKVVCTIDNVDIYSAKATVTDKKVNLASVKSSADSTNGTDGTWTTVTDPTGRDATPSAVSEFKYIQVELDGYMLDCTLKITSGDTTNRISASNVTVDKIVRGEKSTAVIKLADGVMAAKGDKIIITVTDANAEKAAEKVIEFK